MKSFPIKMPWNGRDIPHGIIEVNQRCNISCDGCYKDKFGYEKSIKQIKEEIDFLSSKRNLASITIAGGEPTLYKKLPEIISYISSKGIRSIILTNGTLLNEQRLEEYKKAGVARIAIHIDKHQNKRPDTKKVAKESELNNLRKKYIELCDKKGINSVLQLTIYKDNLEDLYDVIKLSEKLPDSFNAILITLYSDLVDTNEKFKNLSITNKEVYEFMENKENAYPTYYIPSSHNEKSLRWLFYNSFITIDKENKVSKLYFDPRNKFILSSFIKLPKIIKGRYSFEDPRTQKQNYVALLLYGLFSFSFTTFFKSIKFYYKSLKNKNLKVNSILFQQGPRYLGNGEYETCKNCPDATVRNGKIIPVCLVDQIEPIKK